VIKSCSGYGWDGGNLLRGDIMFNFARLFPWKSKTAACHGCGTIKFKSEMKPVGAFWFCNINEIEKYEKETAW
jgi:hypothetical protein